MTAIEQYARRLLKDFHPIIAANRAPVDVVLRDGQAPLFTRGAGGLVTGLSSMAQATGAVWVAATRGEVESHVGLDDGGDPMEIETSDGTRYQVSWVSAPRLAYDMHYNTISNPLLWFVQHFLWNLAEAPVLDETT